MKVLQREPLGYEIVRQKGSHRTLESRNGYPGPILFAYHDTATISPQGVRRILCEDVELTEEEALALL